MTQEEGTIGAEVEAVLSPAYPQPVAQLAGPGQPSRVRCDLDARNGGGGAKEHRPRDPVVFGDDVHAVMHAVDEVDVQESGRSEHDGRPRRRAAAGVGSKVAPAEVRLHLHDSRHPGGEGTLDPDQQLSKQVTRHFDGWAPVEVPR